MSAHRIYCYAPQRSAATDFLLSLGVVITYDVPFAIQEANQLFGLEHITFLAIDGHANVIPEDMWAMIKRDGAIVIHVDDQFRRASALAVTHYPAAEYDSKQELIDHHPII